MIAKWNFAICSISPNIRTSKIGMCPHREMLMTAGKEFMKGVITRNSHRVQRCFVLPMNVSRLFIKEDVRQLWIP